ncbi:hypothetical protein PRIPAC_78645 [Pristionchus pacificus]|uniref:G protein-coupled receptor n=1 Tax=Pristionchus pacificus TaxID=54126 RepID=A0A2A6CKV4_PRIPA|nr:hypothetical protein PRIPAC_78645 [Pristionchus pacificus]|eukprot:PDM78832.1 G protein-coupled receptor [Pristionchus pacificus]
MNSSFATLSHGDVAHLVLNSMLDTCAIVCNVLLITAIVKSTPTILQNYAVLLLFIATMDCSAALMSLMSTAIIENIEGAIIYIHIGPCRLIHYNVCNAALADLAWISDSNYCAFACLQPSRPQLEWLESCHTKSLRDCSVTNPPVANCFPSPPKTSLLEHPELIGRYFSVYNLTAESQLSFENGLPRATIFYIEAVFLVASPILFVLRRKLLQNIRTLTVSSEKSQHQMILRSLTIQMCLPLSFSISFAFWIVDFLGIYRLKILQRSIMPIASIFSVVSPIIIIYYLPPYRKFVFICTQRLEM